MGERGRESTEFGHASKAQDALEGRLSGMSVFVSRRGERKRGEEGRGKGRRGEVYICIYICLHLYLHLFSPSF